MFMWVWTVKLSLSFITLEDEIDEVSENNSKINWRATLGANRRAIYPLNAPIGYIRLVDYCKYNVPYIM